jgi:hypothetical protein
MFGKFSSCGLQCFLVSWRGVRWDWAHVVRWPLTVLLYQPRMTDDEYGAISGMRIGRGNRSTRRKHAPVPLYPPQILHGLTWARTRAAGSQRLTAWAIAWPQAFLLQGPISDTVWHRAEILLCKCALYRPLEGIGFNNTNRNNVSLINR